MNDNDDNDDNNDNDDDDDDDDLIEQSGYVSEALRHLHAAQGAAASESRENARQLSVQQQVGGGWGRMIIFQYFNIT